MSYNFTLPQTTTFNDDSLPTWAWILIVLGIIILIIVIIALIWYVFKSNKQSVIMTQAPVYTNLVE